MELLTHTRLRICSARHTLRRRPPTPSLPVQTGAHPMDFCHYNILHRRKVCSTQSTHMVEHFGGKEAADTEKYVETTHNTTQHTYRMGNGEK